MWTSIEKSALVLPIVTVTFVQPAVVMLVRLSTMQVPPVVVFKTCLKVACNCAVGIAVATSATEEYVVFE
jgi:hypothetical protein